jgi:hypothetical protein
MPPRVQQKGRSELDEGSKRVGEPFPDHGWDDSLRDSSLVGHL